MRSTPYRALPFLACLLFSLSLIGCPTPPAKPNAAFTATPTSGAAPLSVQFTDSSASGGSPITAWAWNFGDGGTSDERSPTHVYGAAGSYTVTLTVTTANGSDTETKSGMITVSEDTSWGPNTETFNVTVAPEVLRVPEAELEKVILQWNPDEHAYLLDKTETDRLGLTLDVGDPLLLDGIEIGRITMVDVDGTEVYIETEMIPLNEVFPDGEIGWDYGVEFTEETVKSIEIPGVGVFPVKAGTPINITFEQGGFKYELKVTLDGATADYDFTVTKGVGPATKGRLTAKGQIVRFRSRNQTRFDGGELTEFGHELNGMRGTAELKLVVTASGNDAIDYKLPVPIMNIPFVVGLVPVKLKIGAQFVVNAAVPLDGSAQVGTTFTYDSDLGLDFDGVTVQAGGRAGDTTFGDPLHMTGASSAIAANFGIGFPRVSLDVAGGTLVPWAQTAFLIGGSYTFTPACQTADAQFIGAMGYDLGILGFELASGSKTLFTQKKELLRAGDCPPSKLADVSALWLMEDFAPIPMN